MRRRWKAWAWLFPALWWSAFLLLGLKPVGYELMVEGLVVLDPIVRVNPGLWFGLLLLSLLGAVALADRIPSFKTKRARMGSFLAGQVLAILHLRAVLLMHQSDVREVLGTCAVLIGMTLLVAASQVPSEDRRTIPS
jgi:FtsH-binding integral membrane protein